MCVPSLSAVNYCNNLGQVSAIRGEGAGGAGGGTVRGSRGAIATVGDESGSKGNCGSEVEEFEERGRRGGREGWSREAQQKVVSLALACACCLMFALRCPYI